MIYNSSLWRNCILAFYASAFGPTGTKAWDNSYKQQHGTFNGLAPDVAWGVYLGRQMLATPAASAQFCDFGSFTLPASFSIMAWLNPVTAASSSKIYISNENSAGSAGFSIGINSSNNLYGRIGTGLMTANSAASAGTTYCVILTGDTSSGTPSLYINNVTQSGTSATVSSYNAGGNLYLGKRPTGLSTQPGDSRIYEFRIYDRILTAQEITVLSSNIGISYVTPRRVQPGTVAVAASRKNFMNLGFPVTC